MLAVPTKMITILLIAIISVSAISLLMASYVHMPAILPLLTTMYGEQKTVTSVHRPVSAT